MTKYFMIVTDEERAEYCELAEQGMMGPMAQGMMGSRENEVSCSRLRSRTLCFPWTHYARQLQYCGCSLRRLCHGLAVRRTAPLQACGTLLSSRPMLSSRRKSTIKTTTLAAQPLRPLQLSHKLQRKHPGYRMEAMKSRLQINCCRRVRL